MRFAPMTIGRTPHRLSLAGCSPTEPASVSPTDNMVSQASGVSAHLEPVRQVARRLLQSAAAWLAIPRSHPPRPTLRTTL